MIYRVFFIFACALLSLAVLDVARAQDSEGACGGSYAGQDRASYGCAPTRKPYCQQNTGRCQCLERKACGGKQDEEW